MQIRTLTYNPLTRNNSNPLTNTLALINSSSLSIPLFLLLRLLPPTHPSLHHQVQWQGIARYSSKAMSMHDRRSTTLLPELLQLQLRIIPLFLRAL